MADKVTINVNKTIIMKKFVTIAIILFFAIHLSAQESDDIFNRIGQTFIKNDFQKLSDFFSNTLDITVESNDGTYGKQQAIVLMKEFFNHHKIASFKIKHKGSSNERTHYAVCNMSSGVENWSVYILLDQKSKIIQLQIEK